MFDSLSERLQGVFRTLRGEARLSESAVESALREIRMALLEADVNFKVAKAFVDRVRERAVGQDVLRELVEVKTPRVLKDLPDGGQGWQVRHALFSRAGFTVAAQTAAQAGAVTMVDLPALAAGLQTS